MDDSKFMNKNSLEAFHTELNYLRSDAKTKTLIEVNIIQIADRISRYDLTEKEKIFVSLQLGRFLGERKFE